VADHTHQPHSLEREEACNAPEVPEVHKLVLWGLVSQTTEKKCMMMTRKIRMMSVRVLVGDWGREKTWL
jgi:hypothetical protein